VTTLPSIPITIASWKHDRRFVDEELVPRDAGEEAIFVDPRIELLAAPDCLQQLDCGSLRLDKALDVGSCERVDHF
jgi:hypothetical protein